ncbi:MAG: response regulator [Chloroflexi bacterium]|nr:response regulator [Chloroflexota bacterium]
MNRPTPTYRILVLDDDPIQGDLLQSYIETTLGHKVDCSREVDRFQQLLATQTYDLIFLDYKLPGATGLEVLAELNARKFTTPVIMMTGEGSEQVAVKAIRSGASDYLVKGSFQLSSLAGLIQKTIQTGELQRSVDRSLEKIRYQAFLLDNLREAVVVWDTDSRITFWNQAAQKLYGGSSDEKVGKPVQSEYLSLFIPPAQPQQFDQIDRLVQERHFPSREGKVIWVVAISTPLRDESLGQDILGTMEISYDISDRKEMEASIQAAQVRMAKQSRLAGIGQLAAGVAHLINNPLTTIIAEAQIIQQGTAQQDHIQESVQAIEEAGWRAHKVVQKLQEFSLPSTGSFQPLNINRTINQALEVLRPRLECLGVKLDLHLANHLPRVRGSARQFEDLWVNILVGILPETTSDKECSITIRSRLNQERTVIVEVKINVALGKPNEMETLFDPILAPYTSSFRSGLELSICREIVRQNQGSISAYSSEQNTTIMVEFLRED